VTEKTFTMLLHPLSTPLFPYGQEPTAMGYHAQQGAHAIVIDVVGHQLVRLSSDNEILQATAGSMKIAPWGK
jgi:hypothetical protein